MTERYIAPIQEQGDPLGNLREVIRTATENVEKEFKVSGQSWATCFGNAVMSIELYSVLKPEIRQLLPVEEFRKMEEKLKHLKDRSEDILLEYPGKGDVLPEHVKKELLGKLDILKD